MVNDQDTLSGYGKTWPLHCEHVNGIDVLSLSPEDEAEHNRLQDEAAARDLFGPNATKM